MLNRSKNLVIRWIVLAIRWYIRRFPNAKGTGSLCDIGNLLAKQSPGAFHGMVICSQRGFRWRAETKSLCVRELLLKSRYSPGESRLLETILNPGDIFVDVGAHIGYFSILASSLVGANGKVLAFEPAPAMQELLRDNLVLNKISNVCLFPFAVSNRAAQAVLFLNDANPGSSSLRSIESGTVERLQVETVTIDRCLAPDMQERVRLVKLDIEGAELIALEGMEGLLARSNGPDVMCEVTDQFLRKLGGSEQSLLTWMRGRGYHIFRVEGDDLVPIHEPLGIFQYNALFTKRESVLRKN